MNYYNDNQNSPAKSFFILLLLTFVCSIGTQVVVMILGLAANAGDIEAMRSSLFSIYALLAAGSLGTFLLPSLLLQKRELYNHYFPASQINIWISSLVVVLFLIAFNPLMSWIAEINMQMKLPESLQSVHDWMQAKEEEMAILTERIVMVDHIGLLFVNIIVMAVFPAIAEEYYFRGSLMHIIQRAVKNQHITIWLTAIIFSAIHIQFFGFLPRMILGVFFGYMLVWTNNIWVPIIGHFINNASVTIVAYYYTTQGKTFKELQAYDNYSIFVYLGSLILTTLIVVWSYKKLKKNKSYGKGLEQNTNIY